MAILLVTLWLHLIQKLPVFCGCYSSSGTMVIIITNVTIDFLVAMVTLVIKGTIVHLLPCSLELPFFFFGYMNASEMFCSVDVSYIV
jgi:hypothetical protein